MTVLTFLRSPLGRFLGWGIVAALMLAAAYSHGTAVQARHDKPLIYNPATHKTWQSEAVRDAANLATCHANVSTLEETRKAQNAAVEALKAESEARVAVSRKQTQAARAVAESYRRNAAEILAVKAGPDVCASAERLIAEAVK